MSIETNRSLGGIGSILSFLGIIGTIATLVDYAITGLSPEASIATFGFLGIAGIIGSIAFVGFILFLIAMYGFSRDYADRRIFSNILYGILAAIITGIVIVAAFLILMLPSIFSTLPGVNSQQPSDAFLRSSTLINSLTSIASLIWVFFIIRSYNLLAEKTGVILFKTGAKVLLASAILNVVMTALFVALALTEIIDYNTFILALIPGSFLGYAAQGLFAVSFFRIKPPAQPYTQPRVWNQNVKYCPNCGTQNQTDSIYCLKCGQKL